MIAVIAPEPVSWLDGLIGAIRSAPAGEALRVFAPWSIELGALGSLAMRRGPARLQGFLSRRRASDVAPVSAVPGWPLGEAAVRAWVAGRADRHLRARLAVRRSVDALAARWLGRSRSAPRLVIAPSYAAQYTLAAARELGATTVLFEDLPWIRGLHHDLDAAAKAHPQCRFLQRYRAPGPVMARQEAERVLADRLIVTSRHARAEREKAGFPADRIIDAAPGQSDSPDSPDSRGHLGHALGDRGPGQPARVLLAGLAAARNGTVEALAAIAERPDIELVVRAQAAGEGAGPFIEPEGLLRHPRVTSASPDAIRELRHIDAVIAPGWCESHLPEVALAARRGLPVIATPQSSGYTIASHTIAPGDTNALGRALDALLRDPRPARPAAIRAPLSHSICDLTTRAASARYTRR